MKAAIYSRYSTDRQNETLIADQVRVCTEHATREGWRVVERFEDQGISGAALGNRPGVLQMREAALARRFDVLLVMDLSRLSRSHGDLSKMIDRLVVKGHPRHRSAGRLRQRAPGAQAAGRALGDHRRGVPRHDPGPHARRARVTCKGAQADRRQVLRLPRERRVRAEAAMVREDLRALRRRGELSHDRRANSTRAACPRLARRGTERCAVPRMDGVGDSRDRAQRALHRPDSLEHERVAQGPGQRQAAAHERPRSEWIEYRDESLRIVPDALFERARQRTRDCRLTTHVSRPAASRSTCYRGCCAAACAARTTF